MNVYQVEYLRPPNSLEISRIQAENEKRGFPGMLGSIDCMHWYWKNCPKAWAGQMTGKYGSPSSVLEAVCSYDLRILHAFFGMPGSCNDLNILDRLPLLPNFLSQQQNSSAFEINGEKFKRGYYLADEIYSSWSCFVQAFSEPDNAKKANFTMRQESARKDVDRAFGVLQQRWHILAQPIKLLFQSDMADIITVCIILHNMIVEDQRGETVHCFESAQNGPQIVRPNCRVDILSDNMRSIKNRESYTTLRNCIMEYQWEEKGNCT